METRSTTYDKNRLITFSEYKSVFTRGSNDNFVEDTKDIFNYDNIELVNNLPNFNKVICTNDILYPADFNVSGAILPTDTRKCLRNIDVDNISGNHIFPFHIAVTQSATTTYFKILLIEGNLEDSKIYNSKKTCYLRIRVELDNEPLDLNLGYTKIYTSYTSYYTYFEWTKVFGIFNNIKLTGVSFCRDGNYSDVTKDSLHFPYVYVYTGNGTNLTWIDNTGTQAEYLSEYAGETYNEIPIPGGSGSGSGSGSEEIIPSNALVVQSNWHHPSYLHEYDIESIIYGKLVQNNTTNKYHLLTSKNEIESSLNEVYFTYFDYNLKNPEILGRFYAFNAKGNGPNSEVRISIYSKVSGGLTYMYMNGTLYDTNFNVITNT